MRTVLASAPGAAATAADRDRLIAAVAGEGWPFDLAGATVDDTGWENLVLSTRDGWIVRFPRDAALPFDREIAALARLHGRVPVPIPDPRHIGRRVRMMAYRKIVGAAFDEAAYLRADPADRDRVARSLAEFLAAVHAVPPDGATPVLRHDETFRRVTEGLHLVPDHRRDEVAELAERFAKAWVAARDPEAEVLLHNDFHPLNMVFDAGSGRLSGVWDFSCVAVGAPSYDLRYFDRGPRDLMARLADEYTALTGRAVDLGAAALARRVEDADDAITTGRMDLLERL